MQKYKIKAKLQKDALYLVFLECFLDSVALITRYFFRTLQEFLSYCII